MSHQNAQEARQSIGEPDPQAIAIRDAVLVERLACAQIAARECSCGMPFTQCHVAQEILLAREEADQIVGG